MTEKSEIKPIRVGSRKSELALIQTKYVISQLQKLYPEKCFEIHTMSTIGDRVLNISLPKIGEKSLFTRDLEDALRNEGVDFVVHSLKDLPTSLPAGMVIGAVLEREDSRDALVLNEKYKGKTIDTLPAGCIIGTSSLRRTAQLRRLYPHLEICDIRGNLNTRLAKLDASNSKFSGIILAQAGLLRMGWMNRISQILEPNHLLYAVGQGALAVECRSNDDKILNMLRNLVCLKTTCRILAERSFLKTLGGGCSAPVAVSTNLNGNGNLEKNNEDENDNRNDSDKDDNVHLNITGAVWSLDGITEIKETIECCLTLDKKRKLNNNNNNKKDESEEIVKKKLKLNETDDNLKIINDDKFTQELITTAATSNIGDGIKLPDIQYLINIHGELFKKCPFYAQHQKDRENSNKNGNDNNVNIRKDECPLNIPIGQDFMGKCPYVDVKQKVELSEKCPITSISSLPSSSSSIDNRNISSYKIKDDILAQGDTITATSSTLSSNVSKNQCPFTTKIDINKNTQDESDNKVSSIEKLGHEICPFIQKNMIKLIDYDEEKMKNTKMDTDGIKSSTSISSEILIEDTNQLFCGLYRHDCYKNELFMKCENIGKQLAENLIRKGALDVMKCAQQEIRDKS